MLRPGELLRIAHINLVLVRHGLDEVVFSIPVFRPFRFLLFFLPWHWFRRMEVSHGVRVRRALEELGPIFVKFGQMLSTRRDLLPEHIAVELTRLQDHVPPVPAPAARAAVERAYGDSLEGYFSTFEQRPLASASIAQVHAARLHDGSEVVVKVLRPGVERVIRRDLRLMYVFARLAQRYWPQGRRLRPLEVVAEYEKTTLGELDLMREGANASALRRNFESSILLHVPKVYWPYTRTEVLVTERIHGIPISDMAQLRAHNINFKTLSARGVEIFFKQVFEHNFFHADMHPGNIFVSSEDPEDPQYRVVDFGIMGTLPPADQRYLAYNFVAFFNRDYQRVAELHIESGWVPEGTRVDEFEAAIRTVCEPIFQRPLAEISFGQLLVRLFQTARRFNMEVQPQLVLLQKTLLNIEGLGRDLDPELNLWKTAKPFLERWAREQVGPKAFARGLRKQLPILVERLPQLPEMAYSVLKQAEAGTLGVHWHSRQLEEMRVEIHAANRRTLITFIVGVVTVVLALVWLR